MTLSTPRWSRIRFSRNWKIPFPCSTKSARKKKTASAPLPPPTKRIPSLRSKKKDPFEEIDFGSFFQDYLDPGYRTHSEMEDIERPSFENFLSKPTNLTDHLAWKLGALSLR